MTDEMWWQLAAITRTGAIYRELSMLDKEAAIVESSSGDGEDDIPSPSTGEGGVAAQDDFWSIFERKPNRGDSQHPFLR